MNRSTDIDEAFEHFVTPSGTHQNKAGRSLGKLLGEAVLEQLSIDGGSVGIIGTASEMDSVTKGVCEALEANDHRPSIGCFWINRVQIGSRKFSQVEQEYVERFPDKLDHLLFVSSFVENGIVMTAISQLHVISPAISSDIRGNVPIPFVPGQTPRRDTLYDGDDAVLALKPDHRKALERATTLPVVMPDFVLERMRKIPSLNTPLGRLMGSNRG